MGTFSALKDCPSGRRRGFSHCAGATRYSPAEESAPLLGYLYEQFRVEPEVEDEFALD